MLGPFLFNTYFTNIVCLMKGSGACNYASDTTLYSCDREVKKYDKKTRAKCKSSSNMVFGNHMTFNVGRCAEKVNNYLEF